MDKNQQPRLTYQMGKTMKLPELREKMRKMGINCNGTKKKLLNRLKYYTSKRSSKTNSITGNAEISYSSYDQRTQKKKHYHKQKHR